jgi:hypothetical protein
MASLNLKIVILDTHDIRVMNVADASTYPDDPPVVDNPTLKISPPGFLPAYTIFKVGSNNFITSDLLELSEDDVHNPLPDGVYQITYSITPSDTNFVTINFMRVDVLMEKFDSAFMKLDMMECDMAIKKQAKVELESIEILIHGAQVAANKCAFNEAYELYNKAHCMLERMIHTDCGCTGNNYF